MKTVPLRSKASTLMCFLSILLPAARAAAGISVSIETPVVGGPNTSQSASDSIDYEYHIGSTVPRTGGNGFDSNTFNVSAVAKTNAAGIAAYLLYQYDYTFAPGPLPAQGVPRAFSGHAECDTSITIPDVIFTSNDPNVRSIKTALHTQLNQTFGLINTSVTYSADASSYSNYAVVKGPDGAQIIQFFVFDQLQHGASNFQQSGSLTSGALTVPVGVPLQFEFDMYSQVDVISNGSEPESTASLGGYVDAGHTFSFIKGSPVFDLPNGDTVNSASADLVNNFFLGETPTVPEPSSAVALLGVATLLGTSRRRGKGGS